MSLLPSIEALEKAQGFCAEALKYRNQRFVKAIAALPRGSEELAAAANALLPLLEAEARAATQREANLERETTLVELSSPSIMTEDLIPPIDERELARQEIGLLIEKLSEHGITEVQVNVAMNQETAELLVGFESQDVGQIDKELNSPIYHTLLNESMFAASQIICRDGVFYQAEDRRQIMKNASGKRLIATPEALETGLALMQQSLRYAGIRCGVTYFDYQKTVAALSVEEKSSDVRPNG